MKLMRHLPLWLSSYRWLIVILLVSFCINSVGIGWGLPTKNYTWATDSLKPLDPLVIAKRAFLDEEWNSGWFYFKYPLGHYFVLSAFQLPYMAWLRITGEFQAPLTTYPYGFQHPERALTVLALLSRIVSTFLGVGVVAVAYVIAAMLFGRSAGLVAAILVTGCYPIVYFAHTSNVDMPMLFWTALALAAALVCADRNSTRAAAVAGIAAGMALWTKEQSVGVIIAGPLVWFLHSRARQVLEWREAMKQAATASVGFLAVTIVFGNLWWNPLGFFNRWRFLLAILPTEIREQYAPYQLYLRMPTGYSFGDEVARLLEVAGTVTHLLTGPIALLCLGGTVWVLWRRPRQALIPILLIVSYYMVSLRSLGVVSPHYTIPLLYFLLILGGAAGGALLDSAKQVSDVAARRGALALILIAMAGALLPGIEIVRLIVFDPRYEAEAWLQAHVPGGAYIETYQKPTRLPRFFPKVRVTQVPIEERTIGLFEQRRPDFVVLSGGARAGLTYDNYPDWQPGKPMFVHWKPAQEFFDRLQAEQVGYRRVAQFHTPIRWIDPPFGSLNPEITIFARNHAE